MSKNDILKFLGISGCGCIGCLGVIALYLLAIGAEIAIVGIAIELGMNIYYEEAYLSFSHGYTPFISAFVVVIIVGLLKPVNHNHIYKER